MVVPSDSYIKITLSNKGVTTEDGLIDKSLLAYFEKHMAMFEKAIQSASNYTALIREGQKAVNARTGLATKDIFVRASDYKNVIEAIKKVNEQIFGKNEDEEGDTRKYLVAKDVAKMLTFKRKRAGKRSQSLAEEEIEKMGGKAFFANAEDEKAEMMSFSVPLSKKEIKRYGGMVEAEESIAKQLDNTLKKSTEFSDLEVKNRSIVEREKSEKNKVISNEKARKEKIANKRKAMRLMTLILSAIVLVANIARRILTVALKNATREEKDAVTAHSLGMSSIKYRNLRYQDTAHGLEEGTTSQGISDVQKKFGDVTNIDEKSLAILARVMGTEVADLVRSGMGGKEPDKLFEQIVNKFFNNFLQGKNSLGQNVGKEQALRELVTVLEEVSPSIAKVFARMGDEYLYGINKGKFTDYAGFMGLHTIYTSGNTPNDFIRTKELGQATDDLVAKFKNLKDNILDKLSDPLAKFISWASKLQIAEGAQDKIEDRQTSVRKFLEENKKYNLMAKGVAEQAGIKFSDKEIASYLADTTNGKMKKTTANKILKKFKDKGQLGLGLMFIRDLEMQKLALEGYGDEDKLWSAIDFSEGAYTSGLRDIDDAKDLDANSQVEVYSGAWNNWVSAIFGDSGFNIEDTIDSAKYGVLRGKTKATLKRLAVALNNTRGAKKIDLSNSKGANELWFDEYRALQESLSEYLDSAKTPEERAFREMQIYKNTLAYTPKGEDDVFTTAYNASLENWKNEIAKEIATRLVAETYGNYKTAEATVKDGYLEIVVKGENGTVLGTEKKEWGKYGKENSTKIYANAQSK